MRRFACRLLDTGPVLVLAVIAGAGSFTHIRDTATEHGQTGWDGLGRRHLHRPHLRHGRPRTPTRPQDRQRLARPHHLARPRPDRRHHPVPGRQPRPSRADRVGLDHRRTPAAAFLIAISMLERRATRPDQPATQPDTSSPVLAPTPAPELIHTQPEEKPANALAPALVDYARRVADDHETKHGKPITDDALRAHLGVSSQLATDLMRTLRTA